MAVDYLIDVALRGVDGVVEELVEGAADVEGWVVLEVGLDEHVVWGAFVWEGG